MSDMLARLLMLCHDELSVAPPDFSPGFGLAGFLCHPDPFATSQPVPVSSTSFLGAEPLVNLFGVNRDEI